MLAKDVEQRLPLLPDSLVHVAQLIRDSSSRKIIGLAGLPGSGKSTFASTLQSNVNKMFGCQKMVSLSMDGFHLTKAELAQMPEPEKMLARRGAPWTFDPIALTERIRTIQSSYGARDVLWPEFLHGVGDPDPDKIVVPAEANVVLFEGLYLLSTFGDWKYVAELFDERWFLDVPLEVSMERLAHRHMLTRGINRTEADRRIESNDRLNAQLILDGSLLCDWRVQ